MYSAYDSKFKTIQAGFEKAQFFNNINNCELVNFLLMIYIHKLKSLHKNI